MFQGRVPSIGCTWRPSLPKDQAVAQTNTNARKHTNVSERRTLDHRIKTNLKSVTPADQNQNTQQQVPASFRLFTLRTFLWPPALSPSACSSACAFSYEQARGRTCGLVKCKYDPRDTRFWLGLGERTSFGLSCNTCVVSRPHLLRLDFLRGQQFVLFPERGGQDIQVFGGHGHLLRQLVSVEKAPRLLPHRRAFT